MTLPELARAAKQAAQQKERRDALIVQAAAEGHSLREIGRTAGLTHAGVISILRRTRRSEA